MLGKGTLQRGREGQRPASFEDFFAAFGEMHHESVYGAIERLVQAGEEVGFTVQDLIRMLNTGMTLGSLLDLIEVRMMATSVHPASRLRNSRGIYAQCSLSR